MTPRTVRTRHDRIMILIGVFLILLFLVAAYVSILGGDRKPARKIRGPVRNPDVSSVTVPGLPTGRLMRQEGVGTRPRVNLTTSLSHA